MFRSDFLGIMDSELGLDGEWENAMNEYFQIGLEEEKEEYEEGPEELDDEILENLMSEEEDPSMENETNFD